MRRLRGGRVGQEEDVNDSICTLRYYVARRNDVPIQENIFEDAIDEICVKSTIDSS